MQPRIWWHCSQDFHGDRLQAKKRPPINRSAKEPETPRLCVSKTIAGCFAGVLFYKPEPVYCYRTPKPCRANHPKNVWDDVATDERWLVPPIELVLDRVILPKIAERAVAATLLFHEETKSPSGLKLKVCQRAMAFRVIGGPDWEGRLLDRWMKTLEIGDPEDYILQQTIARLKS